MEKSSFVQKSTVESDIMEIDQKEVEGQRSTSLSRSLSSSISTSTSVSVEQKSTIQLCEKDEEMRLLPTSINRPILLDDDDSSESELVVSNFLAFSFEGS